jgi:hypothetical protein
VASQYKQKRADLARLIEQAVPADASPLRQLCDRLCSPPFSKTSDSASFWIEAWPQLSKAGRSCIATLPTPCLKHLESRDRKTERSLPLRTGLLRLVQFEEQLFLDGLQLFPHELCRTAESIGPARQNLWEQIQNELSRDRLWQLDGISQEREFWLAADQLRAFRDLPQPVLDFIDQEHPREEAPVTEFIESLHPFLLRKKIEKIRSATYKALRNHDRENLIKSSLEK